MKKVVSGILAGALAASMCVATASAAGPWCGHHGAWAGSGCAYVDANWDGICDSCGAYRQYHHLAGTGCAYVDANWDGVCDVCGVAHAHYGGYFVDADGDGVCDNYGSGLGRGCGHGHGARCGRW